MSRPRFVATCARATWKLAKSIRVLLTGTAELNTRCASREENLWSKRQQRLHNRAKPLTSISAPAVQKLVKVSSTDRLCLGPSSPLPSTSTSNEAGRCRRAAEGRRLCCGVPGPEAAARGVGGAEFCSESKPVAELGVVTALPGAPSNTSKGGTLEPLLEGVRGKLSLEPLRPAAEELLERIGGGGSSPRCKPAAPGGTPVGGAGPRSRSARRASRAPPKANAAGAEAGLRSAMTPGRAREVDEDDAPETSSFVTLRQQLPQ